MHYAQLDKHMDHESQLHTHQIWPWVKRVESDVATLWAGIQNSIEKLFQVCNLYCLWVVDWHLVLLLVDSLSLFMKKNIQVSPSTSKCIRIYINSAHYFDFPGKSVQYGWSNVDKTHVELVLFAFVGRSSTSGQQRSDNIIQRRNIQCF